MNLDEHVAENRAKLEKRDLEYWKRRATDQTMINNDLVLKNRQLIDERNALTVHIEAVEKERDELKAALERRGEILFGQQGD